MGERDDRPAAENTTTGQHEYLEQELEEGAGPATIGAADGTAAVGGLGASSAGKRDSVIPDHAPDPSIGPD